MNKEVKIERVELTTASIEIKTLAIDGKQLTLSVFRQIPKAFLLQEDLSFSGTPLGWVNYFFGEYKNFRGLHILWTYEKLLLRSLISEYCPYHGKEKEYENIYKNFTRLNQIYIAL